MDCAVLTPSIGLLSNLTSRSTYRDDSEFSQIENVDVGVNVHVEPHPVESFTP